MTERERTREKKGHWQGLTVKGNDTDLCKNCRQTMGQEITNAEKQEYSGCLKQEGKEMQKEITEML